MQKLESVGDVDFGDIRGAGKVAIAAVKRGLHGAGDGIHAFCYQPALAADVAREFVRLREQAIQDDGSDSVCEHAVPFHLADAEATAS